MVTISVDAGLFIVQLIDVVMFYTIYYHFFEFSTNIDTENDSNLLEAAKELGIDFEDMSKSIEDYSNSLDGDELIQINHIRSRMSLFKQQCDFSKA